MKVLGILDRLVRERGIGLIMISHDLNLVRNFCDRVLIMYAGQVVEALPAAELADARHDYTRGLLAAQPHIGGPRRPLPVLRREESWKRPLAEASA
jgi:peptide/nickel transport system ATP-binding protein